MMVIEEWGGRGALWDEWGSWLGEWRRVVWGGGGERGEGDAWGSAGRWELFLYAGF